MNTRKHSAVCQKALEPMRHCALQWLGAPSSFFWLWGQLLVTFPQHLAIFSLLDLCFGYRAVPPVIDLKAGQRWEGNLPLKGNSPLKCLISCLLKSQPLKLKLNTFNFITTLKVNKSTWTRNTLISNRECLLTDHLKCFL